MPKHKHYGTDRSLDRNNHGFTIVEVTVVVIVIAILATIGIQGYTYIQKQSRDSQRESDMIVLQNELEKFYEKNGVYPPGCSQPSCTSNFLTNNTSAPMITSNTTLATLRNTLKGLPSEFGDPVTKATTPFYNRTTMPRKYVYFGGALNLSVSSGTFAFNSTSQFPCGIASPIGGNQTGSFVIGYFVETDQKWKLFGGKRGTQLTVTGTAANGCVINT